MQSMPGRVEDTRAARQGSSRQAASETRGSDDEGGCRAAVFGCGRTSQQASVIGGEGGGRHAASCGHMQEGGRDAGLCAPEGGRALLKMERARAVAETRRGWSD